MISLSNITSFLAISAGAFFPLFFGAEIPIAGFRVELNFIAVLLLCGIVPFKINILLRDKFLLFGLLLPFACIACLYAITTLMLGPRLSSMQFYAQLPFLLASFGLGLELSEWIRNRKALTIYAFTYIVMAAFCIGLWANSSLTAVSALARSTAGFQAKRLVTDARRTFNVNDFKNGEQIDDLANNHNRIAQHTFSLAFFCLTATALAMRISPRLAGIGVCILPLILFLLLFSMMLLSGQALGQLLISGLFFLFVLTVVMLNKSNYVWATVLTGLALLTILVFAGSEYGEHWTDRLESGNVSTGRVDRWLYYVDHFKRLTILGSHGSVPIDPHNILVTTVFEIGPVGLLLVLTFLICCFVRPFISLKGGTETHGVGYAISMSVGFQLVFVMMIAGGYGFPGWAEFSKFSLFVAAHRLSRLNLAESMYAT